MDTLDYSTQKRQNAPILNDVEMDTEKQQHQKQQQPSRPRTQLNLPPPRAEDSHSAADTSEPLPWEIATDHPSTTTAATTNKNKNGNFDPHPDFDQDLDADANRDDHPEDDIDPDLAAALGFTSFGMQPEARKRRKLAQRDHPDNNHAQTNPRASASASTSTSKSAPAKASRPPRYATNANQTPVAPRGSRPAQIQSQIPPILAQPHSQFRSHPAPRSQYQPQLQPLPHQPQSLPTQHQLLPPIDIHHTPDELHALSNNGLRLPNGDIAFLKRSFIEDPWARFGLVEPDGGNVDEEYEEGDEDGGVDLRGESGEAMGAV